MKKTISRYRISVAVACLLGLTWVFGFLAIDDAAVAFQVLFCLFKSLQGVFIFVFFAASQSDVRRTISTTIRCTSGGNSSRRQPNPSSTGMTGNGGVKNTSRGQQSKSRGGGPSSPTWARSNGVQVDNNPQPTPPSTRARADPSASSIHDDNMFWGNTPPLQTPQRDIPVGVREDGRDNPAVEMDIGVTMKTFGVDENGSN